MKKLILTLAILLTIQASQAMDSNGWCYQPVVVNDQIYYQQVQCQVDVDQQQKPKEPPTFYGARTTIENATDVVTDVSTGIQSIRNMIQAFKGAY